MKILIIGSCRNNDLEHNSKEHQEMVKKLGAELALSGHEIITGGAGGLQGILVSAYKKQNGKNWTAYFSNGEKDDENARPLDGTIPDKVVETNYNYAMRDAYYISFCDAVIALSGKSLTLAEIIHAIKNYKKKVFQLDMGPNIQIISQLAEINKNLLITNDLKEGIKFIENN